MSVMGADGRFDPTKPLEFWATCYSCGKTITLFTPVAEEHAGCEDADGKLRVQFEYGTNFEER